MDTIIVPKLSFVFDIPTSIEEKNIFIIKIKDKQIVCHKNIVRSSLDFFEDMIEDFDNMDSITLDENYHIFNNLIKFIYGQLKECELDEYLDILLLADKYRLKKYKLLELFKDLMIPIHHFQKYMEFIDHVYGNQELENISDDVINHIVSQITVKKCLEYIPEKLYEYIKDKIRYFSDNIEVNKLTEKIVSICYENRNNKEKLYYVDMSKYPPHKNLYNNDICIEGKCVAEIVIKVREKIINGHNNDNKNNVIPCKFPSIRRIARLGRIRVNGVIGNPGPVGPSGVNVIENIPDIFENYVLLYNNINGYFINGEDLDEKISGIIYPIRIHCILVI